MAKRSRAIQVPKTPIAAPPERQPSAGASRSILLARQLWHVLGKGTPVPDSADAPIRLLIRGGIGSLARYFGMSSRTLRRYCARAGLHLSIHRNELRREELIVLLSTRLPIAEVADRLGFSSSQTLARFVRKEFGSTPTQMRRWAQRGG